MNLLWILIIGGIAGWIAGKLMRGDGYGVIMDIVIGIVGGWLGGWLFARLGIHVGHGLLGSLVEAIIGSVILIWLVRLIKRG
jgi:uncharacterized membrane protein YeaQ/YmgE (transglycosylase-associated protein family)